MAQHNTLGWKAVGPRGNKRSTGRPHIFSPSSRLYRIQRFLSLRAAHCPLVRMNETKTLNYYGIVEQPGRPEFEAQRLVPVYFPTSYLISSSSTQRVLVLLTVSLTLHDPTVSSSPSLQCPHNSAGPTVRGILVQSLTGLRFCGLCTECTLMSLILRSILSRPAPGV